MIWTEIPTTPATPVVLILNEPASNDYALELSFPPATIAKSLAAREERRLFGRSARLACEYTAHLNGIAQCAAWRHGLKRLRDELLAVPLWMDGIEITAAAALGATTMVGDLMKPVRAGTWWVLSNGNPLGPFEFVQVVSIVGTVITLAGALQAGWPASSYLTPIFCGHWAEEAPELNAVTDEFDTVQLRIREDSPYALRVNPWSTPAMPTLGANVAGHTTARKWVAAPASAAQLGRVQLDEINERFGFGRESSRYVYSQPARRGFEGQWECMSRSEIEAIELAFRDLRGSTRICWMPSWTGDLQLTAAAAAGAASIHVAVGPFADPDFSDHPGQPYLAISDPLTNVVDGYKVASVAAGVVTLTGTTARAYQVGEWIVSHLLAVRLGAAAMRWEYETDQIARTRLVFIEQTDEYLSPSSEEPEPVYLYRFTESLRAPFTPTVWRFTSYEDAFSVSGDGTYSPAPFSFGAVRETTRLDREELEIRSWAFEGNPLKRLWPLQLEGPLRVEIFEANAAAPLDLPELLFAGEIERAPRSGMTIEATALPWGRTLEQRFPSFRIQGPCNHIVYSPVGCTKDPATMRVTGDVVSADITRRVIVVDAAGDKPEGYFASGGFVEVLLAGGKMETRAVLQSEPWTSDTQVRLTLSYPLNTAVLAGLTAQIYPGCDGYPTTCRETFDNFINFGGHFYVPRQNPAVKAVPNKQSGGGKKG